VIDLTLLEEDARVENKCDRLLSPLEVGLTNEICMSREEVDIESLGIDIDKGFGREGCD
jgi:hypothetical protein